MPPGHKWSCARGLDCCGDYDALFHCWPGHTLLRDASTETQAERHLMVIEKTPNSTEALESYIPITSSLGTALRYLRLRKTPPSTHSRRLGLHQRGGYGRAQQTGSTDDRMALAPLPSTPCELSLRKACLALLSWIPRQHFPHAYQNLTPRYERDTHDTPPLPRRTLLAGGVNCSPTGTKFSP